MGGADYGTVRAAAFMGLRILSTAAKRAGSCNEESHAGLSAQDGSKSEDLIGAQHYVNSLQSVGSMVCYDALSVAPGRGYLANVEPSRYYRDFDQALPDSMTGQDFLAEYGSHVDAATTVEPTVR